MQQHQTNNKVHGTRAATSNNMSYLLKSDLDEAMNTAVSTLKETIVENLRPINDTLSRLESKINEHSSVLALHEEELSSIKRENSNLQQIVDELAARLHTLENSPSCDYAQHQDTNTSLSEELNNVKERLEERTNRQLRQTLVFKGIKEAPKETWESTKQLLATTISNNVGTSYNNAYQLLNRVQRSGPTDNPQKRGQRDIYANLHNWDHCERLVRDFRHLNIRGQTNVRVDYKYGPLTTNRRTQAMEKRKELKAEGKILSGYVKYPAQLMAKIPGNSAYVVIEDFSSAPYKDYSRRPSGSPVTIDEAVNVNVENGPDQVQRSGWTNSNVD